jgi:hypothetical protein
MDTYVHVRSCDQSTFGAIILLGFEAAACHGSAHGGVTGRVGCDSSREVIQRYLGTVLGKCHQSLQY